MTKIVKYLIQIEPLISMNKLEQMAGIPQSTLSRAISGDRYLPNNHVFSLMKVLIKHFGVVVIDGWRYTSDEWEPVIFATKDVDAPTSEEVGQGFVYHQKQYREFCDSIEIAERLNDTGSAAEFLANWKKNRGQ